MGLDEAAKKVKSLPATVTAAMQIKTLHHHKKHRHGDNSALLQQEEEAKKKSIEAALDKAKLTLSNMMEETKEEMDKAILTCTEFDSQTVSTWTSTRDTALSSPLRLPRPRDSLR